MIGVIDYRAGNSPSVINALNKLGTDCILVKAVSDMSLCDGIILPGVGSASATMRSLCEMALIEGLEKYVSEKPFLGICVGLQVLFEHSDEGGINCLGWLKGNVRRFDESKVRVPQIGWNNVVFIGDSVLTRSIKDGYFYFVNSYYAEPSDKSIILGTAVYGGQFCAFIQSGNIYASQCHLEKSGETGLKLLKNFADYAEDNRKGALLC